MPGEQCSLACEESSTKSRWREYPCALDTHERQTAAAAASGAVLLSLQNTDISTCRVKGLPPEPLLDTEAAQSEDEAVSSDEDDEANEYEEMSPAEARCSDPLRRLRASGCTYGLNAGACPLLSCRQ